MRRALMISRENEQIFSLLENKSEFVNKKLGELHNEILRRRKLYEAKCEKFGGKIDSLPKDAKYFIDIDGLRFDLIANGINPKLLGDDFEDRLLIKMLLLEKFPQEVSGELH